MKTQIILFSFTFLLFTNSGYQNWSNSDLQNSTFNQKNNTENINYKKFIQHNLKKNLDTLKKNIPYKVINSAPTLKYSVRKIGNGDRVLFSIKNGMQNLPEITFTNNSGVYMKDGKKEGFENISFPFKCKINCSVNYYVNPFNNKPSLINDFEIEINEPGDWEISFR